MTRLIVLHQINPWLNLDSGRDDKPEGFMYILYLWSEKMGRGVHRDGTVRIEVYKRVYSEDGESRRELVDTWRYPTSEIHRSARPNPRFGDFYQIQLSWLPYDLSGMSIEVLTHFEDTHGHVIDASPMPLLVPSKAFR